MNFRLCLHIVLVLNTLFTMSSDVLADRMEFLADRMELHNIYHETNNKNTCDSDWIMSIVESQTKNNKLVVSIIVTDNHFNPCERCSIRAFLWSPNIRVYSEHGILTDENGKSDLVFYSDTKIREMELYVAISSLTDTHKITPNSECIYSNGVSNMDRNTLLQNICQHEHKYVGIVQTTFSQLDHGITTVCSDFSGNGYWSLNLDTYTDVSDLYQWKEKDCFVSKLTLDDLKNNLLPNTRIAFVGDSVMLNIYSDFYLFTKGIVDHFGQNIEKDSTIANIVELKAFKTYGYYAFPNRCCGEPDCVTRQEQRAPNMGFEKLDMAKAWLSKSENCILVLKSPVIHQGRAYVTGEMHIESVKRILEELKDIKCRIIWVSATPMGSHIFNKYKYADNRSDRRWLMHVQEKELVANVENIIWLDIWNMFWTRKDRYRDITHVYPVKHRILTSTVTSMLKHLFIRP